MNIIFETQFGSQIYGTSTPLSDKDYKGIFIDTYENIILNKSKESIVYSTKVEKNEGIKNKSNDVDKEYKELRRFIKDACDGQTYALDMLYAPKKWWIKSSNIWEEIQKEKNKFLTKNIKSFIGYIRKQVSKYGMKGSRLEALIKVIDYLKTYNGDEKIDNIWNNLPESEFVKVNEYEIERNHKKIVIKMLSVLEKKFTENTKIKLILDVLDKYHRDYGERSILAKSNNGIDFKAVSHAYRVCYQLIDIATKKQIIFPLAQANYVRKIKLGEINYREIIQNELPTLMDKALQCINESDLPENSDINFWNEFILKIYCKCKASH